MDWAGAVVVLLGGGPSLTPEQVESVRGRARVVAINNAVYLAPWADVLYFCDARWYDWHTETVKRFQGTKVTLENHELGSELPGLVCLQRDGTDEASIDGFCPVPGRVRTGRNGGYQAIQYAVHRGARRVVLLGFDMKPAADGRVHWHAEHPIATDPATPASFVPHFRTLVAPLAERGVEVINATPDSALDAFPRVPLERALELDAARRLA
jgi:hypothetical protein